MKYIILVGDGMADYPIEELGNKTPLEVACTESMDTIAGKGIVGMVRTIPPGLPPGSDIASLSILGYDPRCFYTGRAVFEAASAGVVLGPCDVAFRCNLVTLAESEGRTIMQDYSAGHITTEEAREIIVDLNKVLGNDAVRFYPGVGYRHLMVWRDGFEKMDTVPPHDISGRDVVDYLPRGEGSRFIQQLMQQAGDILRVHQVNQRRVAASKLPANAIWLWGQGRPIRLPSFQEKYGLAGSVISAVDLIKGIGVALGLAPIDVPGATGYLDTNYLGKAEYALKQLEKNDFVFLHVESPDEASHNGDVKSKIQAIEDFDEKVVKTVLKEVRVNRECKVMVLPDHRTPIKRKTHTPEPVPFALCRSAWLTEYGRQQGMFSEAAAEKSDIFIENGFELMEFYIRS